MANKVVALDGGLVDIGSVANTESSTLKDCLNYERGIEHGYTRCDGFSRWDGQYNNTQSTMTLSATTDWQFSSASWTVGSVKVISYTNYYTGATLTVNGIVQSCIDLAQNRIVLR